MINTSPIEERCCGDSDVPLKVGISTESGCGNGSGIATWGSIQGDIYNQIDLITLISSQITASKKTFTFNEADLLDTVGDENWYLPLNTVSQEGEIIPINGKIIEILIDNVEMGLSRDNTFTPYRLYGFANNSSQTIKLTVI